MLGPLCHSASATGTCGFSLAAFGQSGGRSATGSALSPVEHYPLAHSGWWRSGRLWQTLTGQIRAAQGVHIHGVWQKHCAFTAHLARRARKPYIVSAHGMLDSWALNHKSIKKTVYSFLVERYNLERAACLHALTAAEANDCRQFARNRPVAIIPNGVTIPGGDPELFYSRFPQLRDRRIVLFLGRIHAKKGLDILCRAWQPVSAACPDAHLVLAGPDFENTQARIEALVASSGLTDRVTFTGMLNGASKWSALSAAHAFALPSHSEGFSVAVLEALGMGLPVIVTEQCHIPEVATRGCGWVIQPEAGELAAALSKALALSRAEASQMGANGRQLVAERYSWPVVGAKMAALYAWVLGGPSPAGVEVV